nr:hypothetical protein [Saccharopolyspora sp. HNM0986]
MASAPGDGRQHERGAGGQRPAADEIDFAVWMICEALHGYSGMQN